jgi:hypothetical protein
MPFHPFPPMSHREVVQAKIGTPAYQVIHAGDQPKSLVSEGHYSSLVMKAMRPAPKTMAKHLGMSLPVNGGSVAFKKH